MDEGISARRRDRRPRLDPSVYGRSGYAVHITICVLNARPIFRENPVLVQRVLAALRQVAREQGVRLYCYCLMPDHLHLVASVEGRGSNLTKFVKLFKAQTSWESRDELAGAMWQRSFYDRVIRKHEDLRAVCQYILENPVRRGLVADWQGYPFSWLSGEMATAGGT